MRLRASRRNGEEELVVQDGGDDLRAAEAVSSAAMVVDRKGPGAAGAGRRLREDPDFRVGSGGELRTPAPVSRAGARILPAFLGPLGLGSRGGAELQTGSQLSWTA